MNSDNCFKLLAMPLSFDIDRKKLNENYHEIQKNIHPDNYANSSDAERRLSVQKAAQVNDALETLKNPLKRAIYLLSLYGVELSERDNKIDPAFLMEQIDLRENLSQIENNTDPFEALDNILRDVEIKIKSVVENLTSLFAMILAQPASSELDSLLEKVKSHVLEMQFLNRLQEECLNKEEDLTS